MPMASVTWKYYQKNERQKFVKICDFYKSL